MNYTQLTPMVHEHYTQLTPVVYEHYTQLTPVVYEHYTQLTPMVHKLHSINTNGSWAKLKYYKPHQVQDKTDKEERQRLLSKKRQSFVTYNDLSLASHSSLIFCGECTLQHRNKFIGDSNMFFLESIRKLWYNGDSLKISPKIVFETFAGLAS